jgi:hypothetical protein
MPFKRHVPNTTTTKEIIMDYTLALSIAAKATAYLQDNEGSTSEAEAVLSVYALHHALKAIAKHNAVELPTRP